MYAKIHQMFNNPDLKTVHVKMSYHLLYTLWKSDKWELFHILHKMNYDCFTRG